MTPSELKNSILQLAIQGKLVEQRPDEGTGEELYSKIQVEKQALIKAGKIKKEKPLPEISDDEKPFDIPESWRWVRLGSLLEKLVDGTHRTPKYTLSGVPFVSVTNMSSGKLDLSNTKFISKEEHQELWKRCNPERNDILLSKVGTTGVPAIVDTDIQFSLFVSVALLKFNKQLLDIDFLVYAILTPDFQRQCQEHTRGVGNKNWVIVDIANTVFPLPPLAEQKRIVAKIEELLPLVDRYAEAWNRLETLNKRFPDDLKKSLLQLAIQGKLVPQLPDEGTGEELYCKIQSEKQVLIKAGKIKKENPLPEISDDEKPFDIPESWRWVKVGNVASVFGGKRIPAGRKLTDKNTGHIYIRVSDMKGGTVSLENLLYVPEDIYPTISKYIINKEDIYITVAGTIGAVGTVPEILDGANLTENADKLVFNNIDQGWFVKCLQSPLVQNQIAEATTKVGQPKLAIMRIQELLIPLPPLAEQKRIVAKLEESLPLCERLK